MGETKLPSRPDSGMIHLSSPYSVRETLARLEALLAKRGLSVMARIDHSRAAEEVGLKMQTAELLIFGNPRAGTPLMVAAPTLAIDLPLKALAWEDAEGKFWLSYNSPEYLQHRHNIPDELLKNIAGVAVILEAVVKRPDDQ